MVKYSDTISITQFKSDIIDAVVELGLSEKIKLYVASTRFQIQMVPLYSGQIQHIKYNRPNKCIIRIDGHSTELFPRSEYSAHLITQGSAVEVSIEDFRVHAEQIKPFLEALKDKLKNKDSGKGTNTLLKMLVTMAHTGYKYDPFDKKSPLHQEISDDVLKATGEQVLPETIRKCLKKAYQQFPIVKVGE